MIDIFGNLVLSCSLKMCTGNYMLTLIFLLCYVLIYICMYQNKHLITHNKKTKRHHLFFTPKWKLLNRNAIIPQTEMFSISILVFVNKYLGGGGGGGGGG